MRFSAAHDGRQLGQLLDPGNTARPVWADTAYRSAANLALLAPARLGAAVPAAEAARQTDVTAHRPRQRQPDAGPGAIEHVFAAQKCRFGLIIARSASPAPPPRLGLAIWSPT
jgi:transposase, IS5 family